MLLESERKSVEEMSSSYWSGAGHNNKFCPS